jgi:hypothetical protein
VRAWEIAAALALFVLGAWFALRVRALRESWRGRARAARGARGERSAARLLEANGYRVRATQARRSYTIEVDGAAQRVELLVDMVVERDGEERIAEVKTGHAGTRVQRAETRRQLLEYQLATGARSVLLVDPERATITEVCFPIAQPAAPGRGWGLPTAALALAATALWWSLRS